MKQCAHARGTDTQWSGSIHTIRNEHVGSTAKTRHIRNGMHEIVRTRARDRETVEWQETGTDTEEEQQTERQRERERREERSGRICARETETVRDRES